MRWALLPVCLLACLIPLAAEPVAEQPSPAQQLRLAVTYLRTLAPADQRRVQFFSLYGVPPESLERWQRLGHFEVNSCSREAAITRLREVPGSAGLLWVGFLDDYGWNRAAMNAVADRDPAFRAAWVDAKDAAALLSLLGIHAGKKGQLRGIVRLDKLIYEAGDTNRTPTYYDLLYAEERFPWFPADATGPAGHYRSKVDFPRDENDFNFAFGAKEILDVVQSKKRRLQVDRGTVVDEGDSIVAYHNRLLVWVRTATGSWRKTFDFKDSTGAANLIEHPDRVASYHQLKPDASELITNLPNGGQAYLLTAGAVPKRAEFADALTIARDTTNTLRPVVVEKRSCVVCHALGSQDPGNLLAEGQRAGVDLAVADKALKRRLEAFLLSGLKDLVEDDRRRYATFVARTSGWKPEKNAAEYSSALAQYEARLTAEDMARECGVSLECFRAAAKKTGRFRLAMAVQGKAAMPRDVWDGEEFERVMLAIWGKP